MRKEFILQLKEHIKRERKKVSMEKDSTLRPCKSCGAKCHIRARRCKVCNSPTRGRGRPKGSTKEAGYRVGTSQGRPVGTTQEAGYQVGTSQGRPVGTNQEAGYRVGTSQGRPVGNQPRGWVWN